MHRGRCAFQDASPVRQQEELLRIWNPVDDGGRKMVLFVARRIAVKHGLAASGASLLRFELLS